jgi:hypothetical protein
LDGEQHYGGEPNSTTISAGWSDITLGVHHLTAVVQNGTAYASKEIFFRVVK